MDSDFAGDLRRVGVCHLQVDQDDVRLPRERQCHRFGTVTGDSHEIEASGPVDQVGKRVRQFRMAAGDDNSVVADSPSLCLG